MDNTTHHILAGNARHGHPQCVQDGAVGLSYTQEVAELVAEAGRLTPGMNQRVTGHKGAEQHRTQLLRLQAAGQPTHGP